MIKSHSNIAASEHMYVSVNPHDIKSSFINILFIKSKD